MRRLCGDPKFVESVLFEVLQRQRLARPDPLTGIKHSRRSPLAVNTSKLQFQLLQLYLF